LPENGGDVRSADELSAFWDGKYRSGEIFGERPNEFIAANIPGLAKGARVLVPGDGYGRNGVWLATHGFDVTSIDVSSAASAMARDRATQAGVELQTLTADLSIDWHPEANAYDAIAIAFVHLPASDRPGIHAKYVKALAPGGRLLFQAYSQNQINRSSGGPRSLELLYTTDQLAGDFADLEIDRLEEHLVELNEGTHHVGEASVVSMIAHKGG